MSIFDDMDWEMSDTSTRGSTYGDKADPKSLGGYKRWTDATERTGTAKTKESKGKEFLSIFKKDFANKSRDNT